MKKYFIIPALLFSSILLGQSVIEFDDEKVSLEEFKRVYQKNNSGEMVNKSTIEEYLDLYINFKLKVKEAEALGLDTNKAFVKELKGYRTQLAQPYLSEDNTLEHLKKEAYERLKYEVRASHILVKSSPDDKPEDTLKAYQKAMKIRKILLSGADFDVVAKEYSDDPSAKDNGGDLGYFTAFYMVYPFESAAYNTEVGNVSLPIKTRFGYHLVKVFDKRPSNGTMTAAHILISSDPSINPGGNPKEKADEVYRRIQEGDSFEQLVKQFSDDKRTSTNDGLLPPFTVGRMIKEFETAAFALENDGDISKPVKSAYGYHIIKRIKKEQLGSYDKTKRDLEEKVKKDARSNLTEGAALKKIKKDYGFSENLKERNDFYTALDTSYFSENWDVKKLSKLTKTMFKIGEKEISQKDFANYLSSRYGSANKIDIEVLVNNSYENFKRQQILEYKDSRLEAEYPEFKALMQEYHDGILLFNLTDELVWTKAVKDTLGLEEFYQENLDNYWWDNRIDAVIYSAIDAKVAEQVKQKLKEGIERDELIKEINQASQLNLKVESKKFLKGENEIIDQIEWKGGISKNIPLNDRVYFVDVKEVLEPSHKTLEDSRGIITSDYQEFLEKRWVRELRNKFKFSINQESIAKLKSELE